jgi:predicted RNA-binding protein YlqC (UPF0109 family)
MNENEGAPVEPAEPGDDALNYAAPSADEERLIELVGFLVQNVVAHADEVEVEEFFDDSGTVYGVRVHPDDLGRAIGRDGRVANALRSVVKAAAVKSGARVTVEIITDDSQLRLEDAA